MGTGVKLLMAESAVWGLAIAYYLTSLRAAGRSPGTVNLHRHYLDRLCRGIPHPYRASTADLEAFLACPTWSPETRKSARTVVRGFYRWAAANGYVERDPAAQLGRVVVPPGVPRPAPEHVVGQALLAADDRVRLMVMLAAFGGLRAAEIARVAAADVYLAAEGDVLRVRGKGGRVREVPIVNPGLAARLEQLAAQHAAGGGGWAFPNPHAPDRHISPGHVSRLVSGVLPVGWTAHTLRHRLASQAYAGTRDLLAVQALLGHSRPETTRRYVRLPDDAVRVAAAAAATA